MSSYVRRAAAALLVGGIAHVAFATEVYAQTPEASNQAAAAPRLQVTPFSAIGDDLALGGGVALTYAVHPRLRVEGEASLGTDAARSSVSLLYALPRWGCCSVYVAGGFGVQRDEVPGSFIPGTRTRKKTEPAVNIGAGFSVPIVERFGYRFDFRWYNPDDSWPESWRIYNGLTFHLRR